MPTISGQHFRAAKVREQAQLDGGPVTFDRCRFDACSVRPEPATTAHLRVSNVTVRNARVTGGSLFGLIVEDCTFDTVTVDNMPGVAGCLFNRVTLRGSVDQLMIRDDMAGVDDPDAFRKAARGFYDKIEWALDIRDLRCADLDLRGIPSRLIRRNPDLHPMLSKTKAANTDWSNYDMAGTATRYAVMDLLDNDWEDVLLNLTPSGDAAADADEQALIERLRVDGVLDSPG